MTESTNCSKLPSRALSARYTTIDDLYLKKHEEQKINKSKPFAELKAKKIKAIQNRYPNKNVPEESRQHNALKRL